MTKEEGSKALTRDPDSRMSRSTSAASGDNGVRSHWLAAFIEVAEHRSYSEAARRLYRSQACISQYVQQLEDWLGRTLLSAEVTLTTDGQEFLPKAREICRLLTESRVVQPRRWPVRKKTIEPTTAPVHMPSIPAGYSISAAQICVPSQGGSKKGDG